MHGEVVAEIVPPAEQRPAHLTRSAMVRLIEDRQADPDLIDDLRRIAGATTDELADPV